MIFITIIIFSIIIIKITEKNNQNCTNYFIIKKKK